MPSLKQLTGRPSPMALPDPAEATTQAKPCNVRRSPWPFRVMDWNEEVIVNSPNPVHDSKVAAPTTAANSGAPVATGALSAADSTRRTYDAKSHGSIDWARLVHDHLTSTTITAGGITGVFPGALHANSVTAAWAMSNGLGHLVKP